MNAVVCRMYGRPATFNYDNEEMMMTIIKLDTTRPAPTNRYEDRDNWRLVDKERALELKVGDKAKTFRDERVVITWLNPPHKCSSQGKVSVQFVGKEWKQEVYASVIGAEFEYVGDLS